MHPVRCTLLTRLSRLIVVPVVVGGTLRDLGTQILSCFVLVLKIMLKILILSGTRVLSSNQLVPPTT